MSTSARLVLGQAFPFVEMLKVTRNRAQLRIHAVGEHDNGIVVEQMRDGVLVVLEVFLVGRPDVLV